jgi:hypothetical protein
MTVEQAKTQLRVVVLIEEEDISKVQTTAFIAALIKCICYT